MEDAITFRVGPRNTLLPGLHKSLVYLGFDNWNDFGFSTLFHIDAYDENGKLHHLENIKIGFLGQSSGVSTYENLPSEFLQLPHNYFSIGADVSFYQNLYKNTSEYFRRELLKRLRDVVYDSEILALVSSEEVFKTSHLRNISINAVEQQFRRVLLGAPPVTNYRFRFTLDQRDDRAGCNLDFNVVANSRPATNVHAIIGRNGVGKTTVLNTMIRTLVDEEKDEGSRFTELIGFDEKPIEKGFFTSVLSVSFSAFDPFAPPAEQPDPSKGTCYFYVGLKEIEDESGALLKSLSTLHNEFVESLGVCFSEDGRKRRWIRAVETLESDDNFAEMELRRLSELAGKTLETHALASIKRMSSGHAIVLLTITKLVARVEEKTLLLFDEPESHLHPPLLAALIRSLTELVFDRNAVAIIATHSPVVLQEIPKACAWIITRTGTAASIKRPDVETFGENVGVLTREVFGLEVAKSGFNAVLADEVQRGRSYDEILRRFQGRIGFEGRAILRSLLHENKQQSD